MCSFRVFLFFLLLFHDYNHVRLQDVKYRRENGPNTQLSYFFFFTSAEQKIISNKERNKTALIASVY